MKTDSELCTICPLFDCCDSRLIPQHVNGKRLVTNNPWNCRHITCPSEVDNAKKEIKIQKNKGNFSGYANFNSPDKPNIRRVNIRTGRIESQQEGS